MTTIDVVLSPGWVAGIIAIGIGIALVTLFLMLFWIWSLLHCLFSRLRVVPKLIWLFIILVFNFIGSIFYIIFAKESGGTKVANKKFKGKRLLRSKSRVLGGVCAGIGDYFNVDPTLIRLLWIVVTIFTGFAFGIFAYLIAWVIIPER